MVIMVIEISDFLSRMEASQYTIFTQKFHASVTKTISKFNGSIVQTDNNNYLVTYKSVTDAIQCSLDIQYKFKYVTPKHESFSRRLNIALCPSENLNEERIILATRMCEIVKDPLVISSEVKNLYENANVHAEIDDDLIRALSVEEEKFLTNIMDLLETNWDKSKFGISTLTKSLGLSYSQLYRRLMSLTGRAPNKFIKEFRLHKALELLHSQRESISAIAEQSGFSSPSYFARCFRTKYGVRPSKYRLQHT